MRIRTKTILGVAVIEMAMLAILVGSALTILRDSNESELMRRVQLGSNLLASAAKDAVISQDLATLDSLVDEAMASGQIDMIRIIDADGVVLTARGEAAMLSRPFHKETRIELVNDGVFDWSSPVMAGSIRQGEVQLGVSVAPLKILLSSARRWAAGVAGLEMLLVALFSFLLGRYLTRQIGTLREASMVFAGGDFHIRVPILGNDELTQTAIAFNQMAEQIGNNHVLLQEENLKRTEAQKDAEDAQARAEDVAAQIKEIFALSPDGFVSFNGAHRISYVSPAFTRLTGLKEAEVIDMHEVGFSACLVMLCLPGAVFPGFGKLREREINNVANGANKSRQMIELTNGRILEIGLRESVTKAVSQILYLRDITHEAEVDRLKSEFLSIAAHELRTPMASIYGYSEILLAQEFNAEDRREFLGTIHRQSELMTSIINELLDLARIEARGSKDFTLERVDLCELLESMSSTCIPPKGRDCPVQPEAHAPFWVQADRRKLTQAISNVLSNAYKYSPDGGDVRIKFLEKDTGSAGALLGIQIGDSGIGMTPAQLARVFERFYRADESGKFSGTGLGMSIVQEIINLHGGAVEVQSISGVGTTVTLWLPSATV
jgi:signal transduction histidine kinase